MIIEGQTYSYNLLFQLAYDAGYIDAVDVTTLDISQVKISKVLHTNGRPPIVVSKGGVKYLAFIPCNYTIPTEGNIYVRIVNKHILNKAIS